MLAKLALMTWLVGPVISYLEIEYDGRAKSRWVPYPIGIDDVVHLASAAMLSTPRIVARRPSAYGGDLYVAVTARLSQSR